MADKEVSPEEVAQLSARITAIEQLLAQKMPGYEQVGTRVAELSTAFQAANGRLVNVETALSNLPTGGDAEEINTLRTAVLALSDRLTAIEAVRVRGGRLSNRLASIETKLDQIIGGGDSE